MIIPGRVKHFYLRLVCLILTVVFSLSSIVFLALIVSARDETGRVSAASLIAPLPENQHEGATRRLLHPDSEVRALWIASVYNINYPSKKGLSAEALKKELDDIIQTALDCSMNTLYFQVRPSSDALYDSALFPTSEYITGKQGDPFPGGFDPLAYLVEQAHKNRLWVHAWVNPIRATVGSESEPKLDVNELADSHPAKKNPDWVIPYADGKLYYDVGLPEVRELIAAGVEEIVRNYDVDGIIFDDYFYPYPVSGATFDDADTYKTYGGKLSLSDWRRANVNEMVEACYNIVKKTDAECAFGIAPFGIWKNDNGSNGGSATKGMQSYSDIYCDTLAWVKGGYVDYIAPQIYWSFSTAVAPYGELVRWWNAALDEYPDVGLIISHAVYRAEEWGIENEIRNQVSFARSQRAYIGSSFYGYAAVKANDANLREQFASLYEQEIVYSGSFSQGQSLELTSPVSGSYVDGAGTYVIGISDPGYPLTVNGEPVGRTKQGYFSLYLPLAKGKNTFVFSHKGEKTSYVINRGAAGGAASKKLTSFSVQSLSPASETALPSGSKLTLSVTAPAGSTVTAAIGGKSVTLKQTTAVGQSGYTAASYSASYILPSAPDGQAADLGKVVFTAKRGSEKVSAEGGRVRVLGKEAVIEGRVSKNEAPLRDYGDSDGYEFMMQPQGTTFFADSLSGGEYTLIGGGTLEAAYVEESGVTSFRTARLGKPFFTADEKTLTLSLPLSFAVPVYGDVRDGAFVLTLSGCEGGEAVSLPPNPLFSSLSEAREGKELTYTLTLFDVSNVYGFSFAYEGGSLQVIFRLPQTLSAGSQPLAGKRIVLDAGHGGSDIGAKGADPKQNEKDLNLAIVLAAAEKLKALGAEVILTRSDDSTVALADRRDFLNECVPDLAISIHQNSMPYTADITKIRGLVGLYYSDAGRLLTSVLSKAVCDAANRYERSSAIQMLAMANNHKFPSTLLELSFITCVEEYEYMTAAGSADRQAQAVCDGVLAYYKKQQEFLAP